LTSTTTRASISSKRRFAALGKRLVIEIQGAA
jgi:hypothetical protein